MAIPGIPIAVAAAGAVPWKEIFEHAPAAWDAAKKMFDWSSKPAAPQVDPTTDLRTQITTLASGAQKFEVAQAEQAKVVAMLADQMLGVTKQVQVLTVQLETAESRAARNLLVAVGFGGVAIAALIVAIVK